MMVLFVFAVFGIGWFLFFLHGSWGEAEVESPALQLEGLNALRDGMARLQHQLQDHPNEGAEVTSIAPLDATRLVKPITVMTSLIVNDLTLDLVASQLTSTSKINLNLSLSESSSVTCPPWISARVLPQGLLSLQVGDQLLELSASSVDLLEFPRFRDIYALQRHHRAITPMLYIDNGRVFFDTYIHTLEQHDIRRAVEFVRTFASSTRSALEDFPLSEWSFWWQVCESNSMTHPIYSIALTSLMLDTPLDRKVKGLWSESLRNMDAQTFVHVMSSLPNTTTRRVWKRDLSLERWMELAMAAQQEEPSSEIAQACLAQCVSRLELTTLDTQVPKNYSPLYLPLLQHYWTQHAAQRGRVLAMTQSWLSAMNGNAMLSLIIMVIDDAPALCTLELIDALNLHMSQLIFAERESFAHAMMKLLERYPHYVADADWLNIYFQIFPHLNAIDTPIFRDTFIEHAPTALYGNLRNALTLPKIKTSYAANIMTLWLDTLTDQQGGAITLSEEAGPQGALSEVQQSGSLKIVDSKDHK